MGYRPGGGQAPRRIAAAAPKGWPHTWTSSPAGTKMAAYQI